jgi:phosphoribosylformylglycinamidine synthase subunit PurQ / glutaminase
MYKIAILQFPGTNCEYEARRAVNNSGMQGEFFRWNQPAEELDNYDGYVVAGGFSYEDRSRAGIIASLDPIMQKIKEEAEKGKPIIGICNGCQILMETGLVPGLENNSLGGALALNTRAKDGKVIDTGYYNEQIYIKNQAQNRCAFNLGIDQDHYFRLPIAHGEGRFVLEAELLKELIEHNQIVFRYCDESGEIKNEYPINPNGTIDNIAGICNKQGNVLALMPHPERVAEGQFIFDSMKKYLEKNYELRITNYELNYIKEIEKPQEYQKPENSTELLVDMIITDNEAVTVENAVQQSGFECVEIKKKVYWNVKGKDLDLDSLINSGELLNTNKELVVDKLSPQSGIPITGEEGYYNLLVMYKGDAEGKGKLAILKNKLGFDDVQDVQKGILWQIKCKKEDLEKILATNIFYNPFSQEYYSYKS